MAADIRFDGKVAIVTGSRAAGLGEAARAGAGASRREGGGERPWRLGGRFKGGSSDRR